MEIDRLIEYADLIIECGVVAKLSFKAYKDGDAEKIKQYNLELEKIKNKIENKNNEINKIKELKSINKKKVYRFNNVLDILN